jgi:activator of HSP90 ATPase
MKSESITVSAVVPASPQVVYAAWMSGKGHGEMTGSKAAVSAKVGGKFTAWEGYIFGKTLELEPGSRIVQAWRTTEFAPEDPDSHLVVTLAAARGGTKVTLKHSELPPGSSAEYRKGWLDYYFAPMKEYFASRAK